MREFFTQDFFVRLVSSFVASLAFSAVFKIRHKHLFYAGLCGMCCYAVYYTVSVFVPSIFAAAFVSTLIAAFLSELLARIRHAPAIVFLIPAVIPTVPGGELYYAMRAFIVGQTAKAFSHLFVALKIGLGIALGIVCMSMLFALIGDYIGRKKKA